MQFLIDIAGPGRELDVVPTRSGLLAKFPGYAAAPVTRIPIGRMEMQIRIPDGDPAVRVWSEAGRLGPAASFVIVLGWCYRIGSAPSPTNEDFLRMLTRHRAGDPPGDDETSGNFVILAYDANSGRLCVQPDQYAMSAVHYALADGRVTISNRAALVASAVEAPLDGHSLLAFLRSAHVPFGRSLFGGVWRLLSGCFLAVDTKAVRGEVRRGTALYVPTLSLSRSRALDAVCDAVSSLVGQLTANDSTAFDLTGGVDSRLLAAAVRHANPSRLNERFIWSVVGPPDHPDVRVAGQVARVLGFPFQRLDRAYPDDADPLELEQAAVLADGSSLIDFALARLRFESQPRPTWDWYAGGMSGELLRGYLWNQEFFSIGRTSEVNFKALMHYRIHPSRVVESSYYDSNWPSLSEHDEMILRPYREIGRAGGKLLNPYKLDVMLQHRLVYYGGNTMSWIAGIRRIRFPFATWEYCRLVFGLPWKRKATRWLQLNAISRLSPQLRDVPTVGGLAMTALTWSSLFSSLPMYGKAAIPELRRGLNAVSPRGCAAALPKQAVLSLDPSPKSWVPILRDAKHVNGIIDPNAVRQACDQASPTRGQPAPFLHDADPGAVVQKPAASQERRHFRRWSKVHLMARGGLRPGYSAWQAPRTADERRPATDSDPSGSAFWRKDSAGATRCVRTSTRPGNHGFNSFEQAATGRRRDFSMPPMRSPSRATRASRFGSLGWLGELICWGVREVHLHGIELDSDRAVRAREALPRADLRIGDATNLPWPSDNFRLVIALTVFTSILDPAMRAAVAAEVTWVLAPGGALLWYDFRVNNPSNPHVGRVTRHELAAMYPALRGSVRSATLAPPLARWLSRSLPLSAVLESLPFLCTHLIAVLQKGTR